MWKGYFGQFMILASSSSSPVHHLNTGNITSPCALSSADIRPSAIQNTSSPVHHLNTGNITSPVLYLPLISDLLPSKTCSECNSLRLTFDGVDRMGDRLSEEVLDVVTQWPEVNKISFVAHSLGGLVARYAVGRLYQHHGAKIDGLEPINFITAATPHLGSGGNKQLPFLGGLPFLEKQASQTAHLIAGRSGKHLFLTDKDDDRPLLLQMVYDLDDIKFISGLRSFKRRVAYANANYDHVVGWRTSSIRRQHELVEVGFFGTT